MRFLNYLSVICLYILCCPSLVMAAQAKKKVKVAWQGGDIETDADIKVSEFVTQLNATHSGLFTSLIPKAERPKKGWVVSIYQGNKRLNPLKDKLVPQAEAYLLKIEPGIIYKQAVVDQLPVLKVKDSDQQRPKSHSPHYTTNSKKPKGHKRRSIYGKSKSDEDDAEDSDEDDDAPYKINKRLHKTASKKQSPALSSQRGRGRGRRGRQSPHISSGSVSPETISASPNDKGSNVTQKVKKKEEEKQTPSVDKTKGKENKTRRSRKKPEQNGNQPQQAAAAAAHKNDGTQPDPNLVNASNNNNNANQNLPTQNGLQEKEQNKEATKLLNANGPKQEVTTNNNNNNDNNINAQGVQNQDGLKEEAFVEKIVPNNNNNNNSQNAQKVVLIETETIVDKPVVANLNVPFENLHANVAPTAASGLPTAIASSPQGSPNLLSSNIGTTNQLQHEEQEVVADANQNKLFTDYINDLSSPSVSPSEEQTRKPKKKRKVIASNINHEQTTWSKPLFSTEEQQSNEIHSETDASSSRPPSPSGTRQTLTLHPRTDPKMQNPSQSTVVADGGSQDSKHLPVGNGLNQQPKPFNISRQEIYMTVFIVGLVVTAVALVKSYFFDKEDKNPDPEIEPITDSNGSEVV